MACPLCGENCSCVSGANMAARRVVPARFELDDPNSGLPVDRQLIDPERMDPSEQTFAASLESVAGTPRPRFVVDQIADGLELSAEVELPNVIDRSFQTGGDLAAQESAIKTMDSGESSLEQEGAAACILTPPNEDSWRDEVSARLKRYQARRRPREPRYPSLRLKFETPESNISFTPVAESAQPSIASNAVPAMASRQSVAVDPIAADLPPIDPVAGEPAPSEVFEIAPTPAEHIEPKTWPSAKIIEFPGPAYTPPVSHNELAEPVVDRPRILEAPEVVTPPPTLGGILIEEERVIEPERRPGIDMPLQSASMNSRILSAAADLLITLLACGVFGFIFYRIAGTRPPAWQLIGLGVGLPAVFWMAYQYLLVVYSGTTPGLLVAKLQLMHFDGTPPTRRRRRARVLASYLSGVSLGLGYLWQFLDEDALCWHDRVMKTYLAPIDRSSSV